MSQALPGGAQSPEAVVERYVFEATRVTYGEDWEDNHWAMARVGELSYRGRYAEAWALLLAVVSLIDDEAVLCRIGAGNLEDLIEAYGSELIDGIEAAALGNDRLRAALRCVWVTGSPIEPRLQALVVD